jgi:hypothetical protein
MGVMSPTGSCPIRIVDLTGHALRQIEKEQKMTTHNELQEFLDERSGLRWLAEQAGAERPLLDEIEALKNLVETTGPAAWHRTAWRAQ